MFLKWALPGFLQADVYSLTRNMLSSSQAAFNKISFQAFTSITDVGNSACVKIYMKTHFYYYIYIVCWWKILLLLLINHILFYYLLIYLILHAIWRPHIIIPVLILNTTTKTQRISCEIPPVVSIYIGYYLYRSITCIKEEPKKRLKKKITTFFKKKQYIIFNIICWP